MPSYTCDTSTVISRKLSDLPKNFLFSTVVLAELMSGAKDESERKTYEAVARAYQRDESLITPATEDWLLSSKILYWLTNDQRRKGGRESTAVGAGSKTEDVP